MAFRGHELPSLLGERLSNAGRHAVSSLLHPQPNPYDELLRSQPDPTTSVIFEPPTVQEHPKEGIIDMLHRKAESPITVLDRVAEYLVSHNGIGNVTDIVAAVGAQAEEVQRLGDITGVFEVRGKNHEILASPPLEHESQERKQ